jgi:hypothetical protein
MPEPLNQMKRTRQSGCGQGRTVIVFGAMLLWDCCATVLNGPTSIIGRNYRFVIRDVKARRETPAASAGAWAPSGAYEPACQRMVDWNELPQ